MGAFTAVVRRDLLLAARRPAEVFTPIAFFFIVAAVFAIGAGPEPERLRSIAAGLVWVGALLASLLSLPRMFASDHADGTLEQMVLAPQPLSLTVAGKVVAHWMLSGLPLLLASPLAAIQFGLGVESIGVLAVSLLVGTPALSLIGAVGAALTLGARGAGALLALLILPLQVPLLVFGVGAVDALGAGLDPIPHLSLLGASLLLSCVFSPLATALALRISLE